MKLGRIALGILYACTPPIGWYALYNSIKRVKPGEIAMLQNNTEAAELLTQGYYFRPFPGNSFTDSKPISSSYIDFGLIKRVLIKESEIAYKRINQTGKLELLRPGIHEIFQDKETFSPEKDIKNSAEDFLDFGSIKHVRIRPGFLGVKLTKDGEYVDLAPGVHVIQAAEGELFDPLKDIQNVEQDDFMLGNHRHIRIRNGELGESYKGDGTFTLLEQGMHKLPSNNHFVKKVPINTDLIDLGAIKIVTVKEGQVAVVNTNDGVITKAPGIWTISQSEGNTFNQVITTSPQTLKLPDVLVMCSDQIEMRAKPILTFSIKEPLKTVGLGINNIISYLKDTADATLGEILRKFKSTDISPAFHLENEDSAKRASALKEMHDESVKQLNDKAQQWGIEIIDLQMLQILPADEQFLDTIRKLGSQQASAEAKRRLAVNEAEIASIVAKAEESRLVAAEIENREALIRAETKSREQAIKSEAEANYILTIAKANAASIDLMTATEVSRIELLGKAAQDLSPVAQQLLTIEAEGKVLEKLENPVVFQKGVDTTHYAQNARGGLTLFSNTQKTSQTNPVQDLMNAQAVGALVHQPFTVSAQ